MGAWVIREVCRQAEAWQLATPELAALAVSVNLSARQLAHPDLVETVAAALGESGIDPSTLALEVTESMLMDDPGLCSDVLHALRALGVQIAIDDFGTGQSSLGYLKHLPVDCLKIDRTFVEGLGHDPDDTAIVDAVVRLGHALGPRLPPKASKPTRSCASSRRSAATWAKASISHDRSPAVW